MTRSSVAKFSVSLGALYEKTLNWTSGWVGSRILCNSNQRNLRYLRVGAGKKLTCVFGATRHRARGI
jgi:hypothetical protein